MISLITLIIAGAYVGWNIGANDAGNCIGTSVGSGILTFRRAAILVSVFAIAGGYFQGGDVMKTIGKGIVTSELPFLAVLTALLCAGIFVTFATVLRLPVSTSEAIVGGMLGVGLAAGAEINFTTILSIAKVWVICPILVGFLAALIFLITRFLLKRTGGGRFWQRLPQVLLLVSAAYISYSLGANHVGTAMGPIANLGYQTSWLGLLGGFSLAVGALTFGRRVTETVGKGITQLDTVSAFSAQMAAALAVHFFATVGLPVSTSQSIVGGVIAVGLLQGARTVHPKKIAKIAAGWVVTPTAAGLFSFGFYKLLLVLTT
ncbi:anion permease [Candidatus Bipolaricaulota bacterium]|nr:anion permease [Candidatus Bipolaricaulota bacterium]